MTGEFFHKCGGNIGIELASKEPTIRIYCRVCDYAEDFALVPEREKFVSKLLEEIELLELQNSEEVTKKVVEKLLERKNGGSKR